MLDCLEENIVVKVKVTYSQVWRPILGIRALHLPMQVHTHSSEHTPGAVGSHLCCGARGAVGGSVPCSRAPQSWYWRWRERWTFTPPTYNPCRTWDSNLRPFHYESDSLNINPRLSHNPAGARRLCNVRLTLDMTSNRRCILVEN